MTMLERVTRSVELAHSTLNIFGPDFRAASMAALTEAKRIADELGEERASVFLQAILAEERE